MVVELNKTEIWLFESLAATLIVEVPDNVAVLAVDEVTTVNWSESVTGLFERLTTFKVTVWAVAAAALLLAKIAAATARVLEKGEAWFS